MRGEQSRSVRWRWSVTCFTEGQVAENQSSLCRSRFPPYPTFCIIPAPEKAHDPEHPQFAFPLNSSDLQDASRRGRFPLILKLPLPLLGWQRLSQHSSPSAGSHSPRSAGTGSRGTTNISEKRAVNKESGKKRGWKWQIWRDGGGRSKGVLLSWTFLLSFQSSRQPCTLTGPHLAYTHTERCINIWKFLYIWQHIYNGDLTSKQMVAAAQRPAEVLWR